MYSFHANIRPRYPCSTHLRVRTLRNFVHQSVFDFRPQNGSWKKANQRGGSPLFNPAGENPYYKNPVHTRESVFCVCARYNYGGILRRGCQPVLTQNPSWHCEGGGSAVVDFLLRGRYDVHGGGV
ncbi:hypothetical protein QTP88_012918 [Uroleucon formosanum]